MRMSFVWFIVLGCFLSSCRSNKKINPKDKLFDLLPSSQTGIDFINKVQDTKDFNVFKYRNFYNGGGVAIGDINNDGKPDVFFTANQHDNHLYLNKGNFKFEDISKQAGVQGIHHWHTGVTMADVNGDGWLDIYICNSGDINGDNRANELYINQKNGTFKEEAHTYGLDDTGLGTQAAFFDYDHDGDLDCFILNNSYKPIASFGYNRNLRNIRDKNGDKLYRNDNGKFVDVSEQAGIYGSEIGFGLGVSVSDLNNDGWDDIYVSNDFFERDYLYINQHNGTFKEEISEAMGHISESSMGSDVTDMNNDGNIDIFTTDMLPEHDYRLKTTTKFDDFDVANAKLKNDFHHQFTCNCLQLNNGDGTFSDIAQMSSLDATDWSWGALSFDFNNDGWKDIFVSNGISKDLTDQDFLSYFASEEVMNQVKNGGFDYKKFLDKMPSTPVVSYAFLNNKNLTFKNVSQSIGFTTPGFSNGAAYGDLDGDGDLDLVVNNENMQAFVYKNLAHEKLHTHYLKVKLDGISPNNFGIGARAIIYIKGMMQVLEQTSCHGFESSSDKVLNFGTGDDTSIDSLIVWWPNMKMQKLNNLRTDTTVVLHQTQALENLVFNNVSNSVYQNITSSVITGNILHKENNFIDFDAQPLIPKMLSTEGPKVCVGDVNGDGLQDFFIGGAVNDTAKLFLQQPDEHFYQKPEFIFDQDKSMEDVGCEFLDADNDGDLDVVVASGGNQEKQGSINLLVRLYLNDGKGNFTRSFNNWPLISINASCVRAGDFDSDGDSDIFIGNRCIPDAYGLIPSSVLLRNEGQGKFIDVTAQVAPQLLKLGMVTDARWADIDGDKKEELIVIGDYMPVTIFKYVNGKLHMQNQIRNSSGWWNCLTVADLNNDGKPDLIAGNRGINSKMKADSTHPSYIYTSDFGNNGQTESICTYYKTDGKSYPYILRGEFVAQLPSFRDKFLRYDAYAGKTIDEIFTKSQLKDAIRLEVNQQQTCMFINDGKGNFTMKPLPLMAQISPVFGITVSDLNNDGYKDIFLGGNFYGLKPEIGRWDASYGCTLLGNANNTYTYITSSQSGLYVNGEVRDIEQIKTKAGNYIIVARNNDSLQIFKRNKN